MRSRLPTCRYTSVFCFRFLAWRSPTAMPDEEAGSSADPESWQRQPSNPMEMSSMSMMSSASAVHQAKNTRRKFQTDVRLPVQTAQPVHLLCRSLRSARERPPAAPSYCATAARAAADGAARQPDRAATCRGAEGQAKGARDQDQGPGDHLAAEAEPGGSGCQGNAKAGRDGAPGEGDQPAAAEAGGAPDGAQDHV
eukprot:scaffold4174_cov122-Isochrysis_galbana.AAC.14